MNDLVLFETLDDFLEGLGFRRTSVPNSPVSYEYRDSDTVFIFRSHGETEVVSPSTYITVRRMLDERGFMSAKGFENRLQNQNA